MHGFLLLFSALLCSCGGKTAAPVAAETTVAPTEANAEEPAKQGLALQLQQARDKHKSLLVYWGERGVWAESATGEGVMVFTTLPSAYPSLQKDALYYMATERREIRRIDLQTSKDVALAQLPKLANPCFDEPNPVSYIQAYYDVGWDHDAGELCFRIHDRNENMASISVEFRVGLKSGQVESACLIALEECQTPEIVEAESICPDMQSTSPSGPHKRVSADAIAKGIALLTKREGAPDAQFAEMLSYGSGSPSGKWIQFSDFEAEGDYIYSGLLFFSLEEGRVYALGRESGSLVPLDYVALSRREKNAYDPPDDICLVPGESLHFWSASPDFFVLDTCADGIGVLDLNTKGPLRSVQAMGAQEQGRH